MPRGWADLMRLWYSTYTPIRISTDGTNAGYDKKYSKLTAEEKLSWWKLEEANVNPFHTLKPGAMNGVTILDFDDLEAMVKRLVKQINRSEEHTSELQSLMRISYAVFCLKKKKPPLHKSEKRAPKQHTKQ